jgi:hypothetical protein
MRLCVDDRVFAGADGEAHILFGGKDESDVWVGAGSVFKVGREPPLSSRLGKAGHTTGNVWVGEAAEAQGKSSGGGDSAESLSAPLSGLRLDVLMREHGFAFPRKAMRVVALAFPTTVVFQLTDDFLKGTRGAPSRGVLWRSGTAAETAWSASQEGRTWLVPITRAGRFVFQVFSEETRDRTAPVMVEVVDVRQTIASASHRKRASGRRQESQLSQLGDAHSLLPDVVGPGVMVVLP